MDTSKVARVVGPGKKVYSEYQTPKWITGLYYGLCTWWLISGVLMIANVVYEVNTRKPSKLEVALGIVRQGFQFGDYVMVGIGALTSLVGLSLFLKVRFVREFINIICFLEIIGALLSIGATFISMMVVGAIGILFILKYVMDIAVCGGTIWLLSETEDRLGW